MKKFLSLLLAAATTATLLVGCGKEPVAPPMPDVIPDINDFMVVEKVGTINGVDDVFATDAGLRSHDYDSGKYGVLSHEGLHNTGYIYEMADSLSLARFYKVATTKPTSATSATAQNCYGLIDSTGRQIIPECYADFLSTGSSRFIVAVTATVYTTVSDDNTVYTTYFGNEKSMFQGEWCVYDTTTGLIVPGVTGTTKLTPRGTWDGNYLSYKQGDRYVVVDALGNLASNEGRDYFVDGSYAVEGKVGEMFDQKGNRLFSYDLTGFIPEEMSLDRQYYIAKKRLDGTTYYAVMDKTGAIVSAQFTSYISLEGNLIKCDDAVYTFAGQKIAEGEYYLFVDDVIGQYYLLKGRGGAVKDTFQIMDKDGNLYLTGVDDDKHSANSTFDVYATKDDGETYVYCYKDKDYTIKDGSYFAPWVVKCEAANFRYDLVDTLSGDTLLSGYKSYSHIMKDEYSYYVYAEYEGGTDVYLILPNSKIAEMRAKRDALLDELIDAFQAEGITVDINKETGEMAMDASVLFGGDSAVLTDAGKDFLNRFIKVYTQVAFSDKYKGFISKTLVEGHTAPTGASLADSMPLSEERAANVMNYCLSGETGVDVSKIQGTLEAVGYGNAYPILDANGQVNMAASRRVSFKFLVSVNFL